MWRLFSFGPWLWFTSISENKKFRRKGLSKARMSLHRSPLTIRASLALLVVACVVPGALSSVYFIADNYRLEKEHIAQNAIGSARALAAAMDKDLASIESGLHVLSVSPSLIDGDLATFYRFTKEVLPYQNISNYVLLDPQGRQQLNTLREFGEALPQSGSPQALLNIFNTHQTVLTDLFIGPVTGKPILAMGVPVFKGGQAAYSIAVGIFPERLSALMLRQRMPANWVCAILDGEGKIIARTHEMSRFIGKSAVPELVAQAKRVNEGVLETRTLEGISVTSAFSRSSSYHWTAVVGIPNEALTAELHRSILLLTISYIALLSLAVGAAWKFAYGNVISPAQQLRDRMRKVSRGTLINEAKPISSNEEFLALDQGLEEMAQQLSEREHDREAMIRRLSATLEAISDGFYLLDHDWRFAYVNRKAQNMFSLSSDNVMGKNHWLAMPSQEILALKNDYERCVHDGQTRTRNITLARKGMELEIRLYPSEQGLSVYCRDITESHLYEQAQQAQRAAETANKAKSEFLSRISHELRTPLNAVIGFAQILQRETQPPLTDRQGRMIQQIEQAGQHLLNMITDVLDVSRAESGNMALNLDAVNACHIAQTCVDMLRDQAHQAGVMLVLKTPAFALMVRADKTRLKQVLLNLLSNAIKYNRSEGLVELVLEVRDQTVQFSVRDTGIGLSEHQMRHLFEPFNRLGKEFSNTPGTGIGLLISKKLIHMMGGHLNVTSAPDQGSTFSFSLPRQGDSSKPDALEPFNEPVAQALKLAGPDQVSYGERAVLYVEDIATNCEIMSGILAFRPQIDLSFADSLEQARQLIAAHRYDLILLDMQLPDGHGLELLRALRQQPETQTTPVLIVSADATEEASAKARQSGAQDYLRKPLDVLKTLALVDQYLHTEKT